MWEYIEPGDQSMVADGHLPEESVTRLASMVLGSMLGEPAVNGGPPPFSVFEPRPNNLPLLGEVSISLAQGTKERRSIPAILLHH